MRLLSALLLLPLLVGQAHAQSAATPSAAPAPGAAPAAAAAAAVNAASPRHRMSWQQHFAQANTTHDGHLTRQQAEQGYPTIARHFAEIDAGKKGFVTVDDINAWHKLHRALRHARHEQSSNGLHARPAMQHGMPAPHEINTSTDTNLAPMAQPAAPTPAAHSETTAPQPGHGT